MKPVKRAALVALALGWWAPSSAHAQQFSYMPAGELVPGSGQGTADDTVYAPGMRFPIESAPAYANSQVWGHGGSQGPGGGQCDVENFSYPWWDNYCETRSWDMPLCPSGVGHQGQDIRAATCDKNVHWVVASADGSVTNIGSYSVYITAADGTRYDYLHMGQVQVSVGQDVKRGDRIGKVSNEFGGTSTTVHLHFNLRQNVQGLGSIYVPTYMSLVTSYSTMLDAPALGYLDEVSCEALRGWAFEPDEPETPVVVDLGFDGTTVEALTADRYRGDLCENLSFCDHGFYGPAPLSLFDGQSHEVSATIGMTTTLVNSPSSMDCAAIVPEGTARPVGDATLEAWGFSSFWDEAPVDDSDVDALVRGPALDAKGPELISDGEELWLIDLGLRRLVANEDIAAAWHLDAAAAETLSAGEIASLAEGEPLPERPVLVRDSAGDLQLLDAEIPDGATWPGGGEGGVITAEAEVGCACRAVGGKRGEGSWLLALSLLSLARRRRRRIV